MMPAPHMPYDLPKSNGPENRSASNLVAVIESANVETNPRYLVRDTTGDGIADTFCNIALWDWTRALKAEIPHWVDDQGNPCAPFKGRELSARGVIGWLHDYGHRFGWTLVPEATARIYALAGKVSVLTWKNPRPGSSHVAIVRPGPTLGEARIAQAGAKNFTDGTVSQGFGRTTPHEWWIHE